MSTNSKKTHPVWLFIAPQTNTQIYTKQQQRLPEFKSLTFSTQVSVSEVRQRSLKFAVYDINRNKNHVLIGQVIYPLKMFDLSTKVALWRDLESESAAGNKPEVKSMMMMVMATRLFVVILII